MFPVVATLTDLANVQGSYAPHERSSSSGGRARVPSQNDQEAIDMNGLVKRLGFPRCAAVASR